MIYKTLAILAIAVSASAKAPSDKTVHISTNTNVDGVNGLNLNWEVPFKVDDYVVGFRYRLNELKKYPETLFAKKTLDIADGQATVDADLNIDGKTLNVAAKWVSDKLVDGLKTTLHLEGNNKDMLTSVGAEVVKDVDGNNVELKGHYQLSDQKANLGAKINRDKSTAKVSFNTGDEDLQIELSHDLDANNAPKGSYSTKTGEIAYGWTRKWNGGELDGTYHPGNGGKAVLEWTDKGSRGDWKTTADIPLANNEIGNSKVSIKREWKY